MKVIIIKNSDGTCAVAHPCPNARGVDVRQGEPILDGEEVIAHQPGDVYGADGVLAVSGLGREESEDEFLTRVALAACEGRDWRVADITDIPSDRTFRNAWTDDLPTDTVDVDMGRARDVHRETLRKARKPLLEALDVEFIRATERGDKEQQASIAARKQQLRDVTAHSAIAAAATPQELMVAAVDVLSA